MLETNEIIQRTEKLLEDIQLTPFRQNLVWNISGGQIQKLGLAVILAMKPAMIVLDEPTANLDPHATRAVHELVLKLRDEGMTILLVTRELDDFILTAADQLIVLDDGRIMASGPVQSVLAEFGQVMLDRLGIWLPETVEIGLKLRDSLKLNLPAIPISVIETLQVLADQNLFTILINGLRKAETTATSLECRAFGLYPTRTYVKDIHFKENSIAKIIVDVAYQIHKTMGPGLLESAYQSFMVNDLQKRGLRIKSEVPMPVVYDKVILNNGYRVDILVEDLVIVELKAVEKIAYVHQQQLLTYLKASNLNLYNPI